MKKIISFYLLFAILLSFNVSAFATVEDTNSGIDTASVYMCASEKKIFAEKMDNIYEKAISNGEVKSINRAEIDSLMEQATFAASEEEKEIIRQKLAEYGTYIYDSNEVNNREKVPMRSGSGDVSLATPNIFYQSWEKSWTVTCGGNWKTSNWNEQILVGNVGDKDAFGVGYTNSYRQYRSSVIRASAYISDGGNKSVSTSNRSDGDGSKGFGFRLQDYIYNTSTASKYVGYKWYGSCTYDANFGSYNGVATAYYVHTYKKAQISNISFGLKGKTAGVGVDISSKEYSFVAYSNDKTFGVY